MYPNEVNQNADMLTRMFVATYAAPKIPYPPLLESLLPLRKLISRCHPKLTRNFINPDLRSENTDRRSAPMAFNLHRVYAP